MCAGSCFDNPNISITISNTSISNQHCCNIFVGTMKDIESVADMPISITYTT